MFLTLDSLKFSPKLIPLKVLRYGKINVILMRRCDAKMIYMCLVVVVRDSSSGLQAFIVRFASHVVREKILKELLNMQVSRNSSVQSCYLALTLFPFVNCITRRCLPTLVDKRWIGIEKDLELSHSSSRNALAMAFLKMKVISVIENGLMGCLSMSSRKSESTLAP